MSFKVAINKVRQSNNLVESPYAQEFTAHEIKIFEIAVASCTACDYDLVDNQRDKSFSINNGELAKLLNTKPNVISMEIEKTAARITKKTMHLRKILDNGTIEFEMINIIPFAKYKNGVFQFRLNYSIIPYLLEINKNFTEYQLHFLLSLNSAYSIKLYKLLYQYKNIKTRVFSIDELKEQFGIIDKYPQYKNFKQKIIEPSIIQINKHTDLLVSYNEIKLGRKVEKLEFNFEVKKPLLPVLKEVNNNFEIIDIKDTSKIDNLLFPIEAEISSATKNIIFKYYNDKGSDYVEASIDYARKNAKTNLDKYLCDTLKNEWALCLIEKYKKRETKRQRETQKKHTEIGEKKKEEQQQQINQQLIENEYYKLDSLVQDEYESYANSILQNHGVKLIQIFGESLKDKLKFCVYAVSNDKNYDKTIELFILNMYKINLDIN